MKQLTTTWFSVKDSLPPTDTMVLTRGRCSYEPGETLLEEAKCYTQDDRSKGRLYEDESHEFYLQGQIYGVPHNFGEYGDEDYVSIKTSIWSLDMCFCCPEASKVKTFVVTHWCPLLPVGQELSQRAE